MANPDRPDGGGVGVLVCSQFERLSEAAADHVARDAFGHLPAFGASTLRFDVAPPHARAVCTIRRRPKFEHWSAC